MAIIKPKLKQPNERIDKIKNSLRICKNLNVLVDEKLLSEFKSKTAARKTTMTNVLIKAIEDYIK